MSSASHGDEKEPAADAQLSNDISEAVSLVTSDNPEQQLSGTRVIRRIVSDGEGRHVPQVLESGVVPRLVEFIQKRDGEAELQFEAAWVLTNVASSKSEYVTNIMEAGALSALIHLLQSPDEKSCEQAVWCIGNIAGDSSKTRDECLKAGVVEVLIQVAMSHKSITFLQNWMWTLSNLSRGKPAPDYNKLKAAIPVVTTLLHSNDDKVVEDACWFFSYLIDGSQAVIRCIVESGVVRRLVELMATRKAALLGPVVRIIGGIASGNAPQTQVLLDSGVLHMFAALVQHPSPNIQREVYWALSNIAAGTIGQVQALIEANLVPAILQCCKNTDSDSVRKEAAYAVANFASCGSLKHVAYLVQCGAVESLGCVLGDSDSKTVCVALDGLLSILEAGERHKKASELSANPYVNLIRNGSVLNVIEKLLAHQNVAVYEGAYKILQKYFDVEEEELGNEGQHGAAFDASQPSSAATKRAVQKAVRQLPKSAGKMESSSGPRVRIAKAPRKTYPPSKQKKKVPSAKLIVVKKSIISKAAIKRLAARAGITRLSATMTNEISAEIKLCLIQVLHGAAIYMEGSRRRTVNVDDVIRAMADAGTVLLGYT